MNNLCDFLGNCIYFFCVSSCFGCQNVFDNIYVDVILFCIKIVGGYVVFIKFKMLVVNICELFVEDAGFVGCFVCLQYDVFYFSFGENVLIGSIGGVIRILIEVIYQIFVGGKGKDG